MRIKMKQTVTLLSIGLLLMSSYSSFSNKVNSCLDDDCCDCHHDYDEIIYSKDLSKNQITNFGPKIVFNSDSVANYGEIIVEANYLPKGSITDTIWTTSNNSKVTVNPIGGEYSNVCKLIAVNKFSDEVIVTAQSKMYSDIKYESKVSWRSNLIITPLASGLTLSATKTYNCPASYSTNYMSKALSQLFTIDGSTEGMSYSLSNSNVIISGSDVKANSLSNCTSILTATSIEDTSISASIPITVSYSVNGNSTTHSYKYSTCTTRYETTTSYGDWVIDTNATCTSAGSKHRTKTITKLRYDNDKYVCKFCGDYYWSGEYHNVTGDSTSTTTETSSISALGHDWIAQYGGKCPVCGRTYPYPGFKCPIDGAEAVSYLKGYVCSRCGATK